MNDLSIVWQYMLVIALPCFLVAAAGIAWAEWKRLRAARRQANFAKRAALLEAEFDRMVGH